MAPIGTMRNFNGAAMHACQGAVLSRENESRGLLPIPDKCLHSSHPLQSRVRSASTPRSVPRSLVASEFLPSRSVSDGVQRRHAQTLPQPSRRELLNSSNSWRPVPGNGGVNRAVGVLQAAPRPAQRGLVHASRCVNLKEDDERSNSVGRARTIDVRKRTRFDSALRQGPRGKDDVLSFPKVAPESFNCKGREGRKLSRKRGNLGENAAQRTPVCNERWAGPGYSSSPPPSSLPLPRFSVEASPTRSHCADNTRDLRSAATVSVPMSPAQRSGLLQSSLPVREEEGAWNVSCATKNLRRMLKLDSC